MNIIIERARLHHVETLQILACTAFTETFGHLYTVSDLAVHLAETCSAAFFEGALMKGDSILIAYANGLPIGYIKYGEVGLPIKHTEADAEIHRLYVLSGHHRNGIGKRLMDMALADPQLHVAPNLFLGVWESNAKAQRFYSGYGFKPVGEYHYFVGTHADREIILCRAVS